MADGALFVVVPPMATVAAGWIELSLDLVQGHEIAAMRHFAFGAASVLVGGLRRIDLAGMAIPAEGTLVAGCAEAVVGAGIQTMVADECRRMAECLGSLHGTLILIFVAFKTVELPLGGQRLRVGGGQYALPGAGGNHGGQPDQKQGEESQGAESHLWPPLPVQIAGGSTLGMVGHGAAESRRQEIFVVDAPCDIKILPFIKRIYYSKCHS